MKTQVIDGGIIDIPGLRMGEPRWNLNGVEEIRREIVHPQRIENLLATNGSTLWTQEEVDQWNTNPTFIVVYKRKNV